MSRAALALALAALALGGCETSQEKSAKLEKLAKAKAALVRAQSIPLAQRVARASSKVRVTAAALLHTSEATAAVLTLRNSSATAVRDLPIEIDIRGVGGVALYTNATQGLSPTLVTVPLVAAHSTVEWIDDQIQVASSPVSVTAKVGEGATLSGGGPAISVAGHLTSDMTSGAEVEGDAFNHSAVEQQELVVNCVAVRDGRVVAAGRAVLAQVPAGASARFQAFFVGSPAGAQLQLSAPPTTVG